jgi:NTP pyrophosphatase (non-canonical NTP hydrolase)
MNSKEQMELTMIAKEHNIAVDDIQRRALETWHDPAFFPDALMRDHAILGLVGEAGENAELHKKDLFKPGYQTTREERLDELGDVLYYIAILAWLDGCTIDELSRMNHEKLSADGHGWQPNFYKYDEESHND